MLETHLPDLLQRLGLAQLDPRIVTLVAGVALLAAGRRLYWLLAGLAGFVAGSYFAIVHLDLGDGLVPLVVAVVAGLVCGVAVVLFQKLAVFTIGFVAAALAVLHFATTYETPAGYWLLAAALVAGLLGAFLARSLFEMALIVFTAVAGAALTVIALEVPATTETTLLVVLAVVGVLFQVSTRRKRKAKD